MRRFILKSILLLTGLTACLSARSQSYEELWKQVETAQDSGRVGPIGKCLEQVWRKAGKERNFPQRLRALLLQIAYREAVRPRSIYPNMRRIKHWAETCREPADKRVLQMVLSHMYMRKANHRPDTVAHVDTLRADEPDALWTGDRFRKEAMACFDRALADKDLLAHVNARAYEPMVIVGEDSRYFRHDLLSAMAQDVLKWQKHLDERYVLGLYDSLIDYYEEAGNRDAAVLFAYDRIQYLFDRVQVFVLERTSGRPVAGARVECYATTDLRWRNEENYLLHEYAARPCLTLQTGDDGSATFRPDSTECTIGICAQKAGCGYTDTLRVTLRVREHRPYRDWAGYIKADTLFFNQVLSFHGALYDVCGRKAKPVARHTFDVSLYNDPYPRRHRYKAKVTTDSAGRFRGRFVLPKELRDEVFFLEAPYMARNVAFLHKPDTTPRLFELERPADVLVPGDSIRLRGRAWQTDGTPLAHADVNYRITSATGRWTGSRHSTAIQKIFAGQTVTDADGRFAIPLHLKNYHKEPSPEWYMSHRIEVEMPGSDGLRIRRMAYTGSSAIVLNVEGARAWEKGRPAPFQIGAEYLSGWPILSLKGRCVFFRVDDFAPDPFSVKGDSVCAVRFAVGKPFRPSVASRLPSGCYYLEFRAADPPQCPMHKNQLLLKSTRFRFHTPPCRVPEWRLTAWDAVVVQTRTYLPKAEQGTPMENALIYVPDTGDNPYAKGSPGSAAYVSPSEWDKGIGG